MSARQKYGEMSHGEVSQGEKSHGEMCDHGQKCRLNSPVSDIKVSLDLFSISKVLDLIKNIK